MSVFADSSALVKLYSDEAGYEGVRTLDGIVVSALARVEVPAALWRKAHLGELEPSQAEVLVAAFERDLLGDPARFASVSVGPEVLERAARLTAAHGLRAYDAVQLASALVAAEVDPELSGFACFDGELRAAAARNRLALVPA